MVVHRDTLYTVIKNCSRVVTRSVLTTANYFGPDLGDLPGTIVDLPHMEQPQDVSLSRHHATLYVVDRSGPNTGDLWVYRLEDNLATPRVTPKWYCISIDNYPVSLSVYDLQESDDVAEAAAAMAIASVGMAILSFNGTLTSS